MALEHRVELLESLGSDWPWPGSFGRVDLLDGPSLPFGAEQIEVVIHDGHAPGHSALWLPERGVLIAGDMLSEVELPLPFWPDDLRYLDAVITGRPSDDPRLDLPGMAANHAHLVSMARG